MSCKVLGIASVPQGLDVICISKGHYFVSHRKNLAEIRFACPDFTDTRSSPLSFDGNV